MNISIIDSFSISGLNRVSAPSSKLYDKSNIYLPLKNSGSGPCRAVFIPISIIIGESALHLTSTWLFLLPHSYNIPHSVQGQPAPFLVPWFSFPSPFSLRSIPLSLLNHPLLIYRLFPILEINKT